MKIKKCSVCDQEFSCAALDKDTQCWCASFPVLIPVDSEIDCLCSSCLEKAVAKGNEQINSVE